MHRQEDYSNFLYGSIQWTPRTLERTAKVIASEVAVGQRTYYGTVRPIGEPVACGGPHKRSAEEEFEAFKRTYLAASTPTPSSPGSNWAADESACPAALAGDWTFSGPTDGGADDGGCRKYAAEERRRQQPPPSTLMGYAGESSPLPLQLFISSLSDALSYTSAADTTTAADFTFNDGGAFGPRGSSVLHVTPMGSTTKLITSDTSSTFRFPFFGKKCLSIFGTLFMTISLTVSLGNILRLPTTVFLHGGGTFLVAYICVAFLIGTPLTFLEITLGQFCQQGTTKLWRAVPIFKGIGVVKLLSCVILCLYYPICIINAVFYAIWSSYQPFSTTQCFAKLLPSFLNQINSAEFRDETLSKLCSNNETFTSIVNNDVARSGIEICLMLLVCIIIILCVLKNGDSLRISSCIIVPCAMFIAVTLFIEGIYRNMRGMNVLVTNIKWESLLSFNIWYTALIQFFFSSHVGLGNITTCAGRLYPKNNPFWTAICYVFLNVAIGVGFVCVLYMWVDDLISTGNVVRVPETQELFLLSLIYDVMTRCYGKFAYLWAFMSYLLIILAGIISMISLIYTIVVGISIEAKNKWKWWQVCVLVTGVVFIISCSFMLPNLNIIRLFDYYVVGKLIILTTVLEVMAFVWFYGLESLSNDFEFVLGYKLNTAWKTSWFLVPIVLSMAEMWSWFSPVPSNTLSRNPDSSWYAIFGWVIYLFAWLTIAIIAAWQVFSQVDYNFSQKLVSSTKPTRNWGPVDPIYRHCWIQWKKQYQVTGEKDFTLRRRGTRDYTHSVKRGRHAGPVGMRYSVNSSSNQNTLEHKRNHDNSRLQYSYSVDSTHTWNSNDFHLTTNGVKSIY